VGVSGHEPIPDSPVLRVPPGFTVNLFAENLDAPRWLTLTPSGDVLVTETRQNRIRLLRDTNDDGVGSWNRNAGTGYKIVFVPFENGRPQGYYEDFLTGFPIDPSGPTTWGRPVGLLVLPDGSLLLTEEANNRIYRVQYTGN